MVYSQVKMDAKSVYCVCGQPYDEKKFMIQCDSCREWYHGSCVGVHEYMSYDLDKYYCSQCEPTVGPPIFKSQNNYHRHNYYDVKADGKPVQTGTLVFIKELKTRHFPSADPVVLKMDASQLTVDFLLQNGFDQPIIIEEKEGLGLRVPSEYFTVQDVEALVGSDKEVDVIDVARQSDIRMRFCDFVKYFNNPMRQRVLNLISLEFSNSKMSDIVETPLIARQLDWVNTMWPITIGALPTVYKRPEVQKYCLIGVKDSYTDFHIDFGGTSVWYHVLRGEKIFYLIKPTLNNLALYQRWMTSTSQHETFFGDQVDCCYRCIVQAGHTMMIPTGWIHAVLTPVDTLVFGGNFLHSLNIPMQLQIYEIEKKIKTPERFRFPAFEAINWYAAKRLCEKLKMINEEASKVPQYLLVGVKSLLFTLKQWSQDRDTNKSRKEEIPSIIDAPKLLKDLSKEIRQAERYLNSLNPPKPERESKRKKKKPINKDFVDYSQPQSIINVEQVKPEVKEPIKLNMKILSKKMKEQPIVRPPLKLTLPKPATYPYTTPLSENKQKGEGGIGDVQSVQAENKTWFIAMDASPHVKMKTETVGLKVKFSKQPEITYTPPLTGCQEGSSPRKPQTDSVYDFHDGSDVDEDDDILTIDESPKKKRWNKNGTATAADGSSPAAAKSKWGQSNQTQIHLNNLLMNLKGIKPEDLESVVDVTSDLPKNGIEELLKASGYTREQSPKIEELEGGRTSPSTREAIAGMLSISTMYLNGGGEGSSSGSHKDRSKKRKHHQMSSLEHLDEMEKVHQDDDFSVGYSMASWRCWQLMRCQPRRVRRAASRTGTPKEIRVVLPPLRDVASSESKDGTSLVLVSASGSTSPLYPSLDLSDDEEIEKTSRGGKKNVDEAWNPKARVGPVAPKTDRPSREGAKKQAVEKGLEAAAAKRASLPVPKRPYHKKKPKLVSPPPPSTPAPAPTPAPTPALEQPSTSQTQPTTQPVRPVIVDLKNRKPKKGMATAKQRLGKILKIHKMYH